MSIVRRENGKKIADKNWVLTAYDEKSADSESPVTTNKSLAGSATDKSHGKDTIIPNTNNELGENNDVSSVQEQIQAAEAEDKTYNVDGEDSLYNVTDKGIT